MLVFSALRAAGEGSVRWYSSNAAGMTLGQHYSQAAALRNEYSLSVVPLEEGKIPGQLKGYYDQSWNAELRTLYKDAKEERRQFVFIDAGGTTRLNAVLAEEDSGSQGVHGFIERYDKNRLLAEEHQIGEDGLAYITSYFYRNQVLVKAETRRVKKGGGGDGEENRLISTDTYRYTRANALRLVERIVHPAGDGDKEDNAIRQFRFPYNRDTDFVNPSPDYGSEFLRDTILSGAFRVVYTTDDRGRVLTETRKDESGKTAAEIINTWSGDRLAVVEWISEDEERRTEYGYDNSGNRITERNYNKGVLERTVNLEGSREVELLYMNGVAVLRAVWENGRKISEERLRPSAAGAIAPRGQS
ncbi:hypothetical protein FACS1894147_01230 [Spirochaetia bacterium]|nr:hypothetical protein FACS1894147_01230 [Spirochaetia bacterium]